MGDFKNMFSNYYLKYQHIYPSCETVA